MAQKYIIDVDTGVDDAQAIMLALSKPNIEVLGITCVSGNCGVNQVCLNTLKVLSSCDRLDVPVFKGASTALVGEGLDATHYHGSDGLGDANLDIQVSMDQIQQEHAVNALVRLVNQYPGEITLVALAPLTNIAMAIRQDPEFGKKLKSITVMGGNVEARGRMSTCAEFNFFMDPEAACVVLQELSPINLLPYENKDGPPWVHVLSQSSGYIWRDEICYSSSKSYVVGKGNSTVCGEFNFASDPDAAAVVLNEIGIMIDLHPWEINLTSATGLPWEWFDKWIEADTKKGRFNKAILNTAVHAQKVIRKMPIYRSCDLNAMVTVVDPSVIVDTYEVYATVELQGKYTRGMMVVDWNALLGRKPNVKLMRQLDTTKTRVHFEAMVQ